MKHLLSFLFAIATFATANSAFAQDGCSQNSPVANDACYRQLRDVQEKCNRQFPAGGVFSVERIYYQSCQQFNGDGSCASATFSCIVRDKRTNRIEDYKYVGVRG